MDVGAPSTMEKPGFRTLPPSQHALRIALLMAAAGALLAWGLRHSEASFADGLRSIRQAERLENGAWRDGLIGAIDHPLHPLGLVAAHAVVGGEGPVSWQRAAIGLAFGCVVLLVIPLYLLARDAFGDQTAWLGCLLVMANPLLTSIVANVLSESSFLVFWTWGLWAAVRFLREGRFAWLPLTIGFGVLAYLSRPEGLLLPLAMVGALAVLPLHHTTRINWPRWSAAMAFLVLGSLALAGPYMALKGGVGTKPAIARVLGLAPSASTDALERERPLPPDQTAVETYRLAAMRMIKVMRGAASPPLFLLAMPGLFLIPRGPARARLWLFFGILLFASAIGLIRLHATGGYCTSRHALIPGILLILAGAHGMVWLMGKITLPGAWLGLSRQRLRLGPAVWAVPIMILIVLPRLDAKTHLTPGPFCVYRDTGAWLEQHTRPDEPIVDLTDWSLYLSGRAGYGFADASEATADPRVRWIIAREPQIDPRWNHSRVVRRLIGEREPVLLIPPFAEPGRIQVRVYDRLSISEVVLRPEPAVEASRR